jgi:acyl-CoA dehydrogenase
VDNHHAETVLTEPNAGSDAASIMPSARREGDTYVLNGRKISTTKAAEAGVFTVLATVDQTLGRRGISAFVVAVGTPGLEGGRTLEMVWCVQYGILLCRNYL